MSRKLRTPKYSWTHARAWLYREIRPAPLGNGDRA
jgi:hypothetical protein